MSKKIVFKKDVDYTVEVSNGQMTVRLLQKGNDGRYHSATSPYPDCERIYNAETRQTEIKRLTRKQCIEALLHRCRVNAAKMD